MKEAFVKINNIPTKILTCGRWITDEPKCDKKKIIIIIPGNPGIPSFYGEFMNILHEKHSCPVWTVGYSGHEWYTLKTSDSKFPAPLGLKAQIEQKVSFIETYVPENAQVHLIGHSIGAYMVLKLLKESSVEKKITQTYLLFPTIEHLGDSPNGRFFIFIKHFLLVVIFLAWIFTILPKIITVTLLKIYMYFANMPKVYMPIIYELINPDILRQVFHLASEEMEQVRDLDNITIKNNLHRINGLYSDQDKWCPIILYENIKRDYPNINVKMTKCKHAFIFNDNEEVAEFICEKQVNSN